MTFVNGELQARFMTRIRGLDPQRCLVIPVDVGKAVPVALVADHYGEVLVAPFEFALTEAGFAALWVAITRARHERDAVVVRIGVEAAGHCHRTLVAPRAAATEIPEAASATADTEDSVALPPRRMKTSVLLVLVVGIGFGAAAYLWGLPKQTPDCRTADKVVDLIYAHRELLDAGLITPGDPDLKRYQDWSEQLQDYARQVSGPHISRHLDRIAELSVQAVSLVQDIRKDPVVSPSPDVIRDHETAYQKTISELIAEEGDLVPICHPHN